MIEATICMVDFQDQPLTSWIMELFVIPQKGDIIELSTIASDIEEEYRNSFENSDVARWNYVLRVRYNETNFPVIFVGFNPNLHVVNFSDVNNEKKYKYALGHLPALGEMVLLKSSQEYMYVDNIVHEVCYGTITIFLTNKKNLPEINIQEPLKVEIVDSVDLNANIDTTLDVNVTNEVWVKNFELLEVKIIDDER